MGLVGALSKPCTRASLVSIARLQKQMFSRRARMPLWSELPARGAPLLRTVEEILLKADRALHIAVLHA